jgi:hypothetical protein
MIALTLELGRINKARIFVGKNGKKYLSFILVEAPDVYGNAGQVVHSISKEDRAAGAKGEIVGNWKHIGGNRPKQPRNQGTFDTPEAAYAAAQNRSQC